MLVSMKTRILSAVLLSTLTACDATEPDLEVRDRPEGVVVLDAREESDPEPRRVSPPVKATRANPDGAPDVDPCAGAPENPGITLRSDEVAVADLCISEIPLVSGCWIATGDDEVHVEIWCDFACGPTVTVDTSAAFPAEGEVRIELVHPCASE